jgi:phosphopantothenoylcysteine decarboxylase / phosphopantothenate---cysteine ligase
VVGFAAETHDMLKHGHDKLRQKKLDLLFANEATATFNNDTISVTAISAEGEQILAPGNKSAVARNMLQLIAARLD